MVTWIATTFDSGSWYPPARFHATGIPRSRSPANTRQSRNGKRRERLQESLSRMLYNETKRRPMVFSVINEN